MVGRERVSRPRAEVVRDDIDAAVALGQALAADELVQVARDAVEVVAGRRPVAVAEAGQVDRPDAAPRLREQRHHVAPGDQALGPAVQQQHRLALADDGVMDAHAVDQRVALREVAGLARLREQRAHAQRQRGGAGLQSSGHVAPQSAAAWRISAATSCGWDTITTCDAPGTTTTFLACARSAMKAMAAGGMLRSPEP